MVVWFLVGSVGAVIVFWIGVGTGFSLGGDEGGTIGAFIGWILGFLWGAFSLIMAIIQLVHLIQLIIGG
jgi:hypothetical protein